MEHENIVRFYGLHETDEYYVLEMEYVAKGTLREFIKEMESDDEMVADIMR